MKVNKTLIVGYLVREPEENGKAIKFTIAVTRDYKNINGEYESDFIRCVAFGATGNFIKEYCHKGDLIGIDGSITTSKYEKDGKTFYNTEIMANKTRKLSSKGNSTLEAKESSKGVKNGLNDKTFEEFAEQIEIDNDLGW